MRSVLMVSGLVLAATFAEPARAQAGAEPRIALVIGNAAYEQARLTNPVNDVTNMAAALRSLGFEVTLRTNADNRQMRAAIRDFARTLTRGGNVLDFRLARAP